MKQKFEHEIAEVTVDSEYGRLKVKVTNKPKPYELPIEGHYPNYLVQLLNFFGSDGWDVYQVINRGNSSPKFEIYMKREIKE